MYIKEVRGLEKALIAIQQESEIKSLLLFGCDSDKSEIVELEGALSKNIKPLIGGIFPEIIADGIRHHTGFVLIPLRQTLAVGLFESVTESSNWVKKIEDFTGQQSIEPLSIFCFLDAFWPQKTQFMSGIYDMYGPFVKYLGGGAGSLSFKSMPCIFANQKIVDNAAVIGLMQEPMSIGVAHGWHPISDAIKVTETKGNSIITLNWRPAFEVYSEQIFAHSQQIITKQNFFEIAKSYPLGLVNMDDEMLIRDPFATENGMLHIVDEVPEGEYIRIMHGDMFSLLSGAELAMTEMGENQTGDQENLCIDCISRVLFMNDDFSKELAILNRNQPINGVLSIGEIANPGSSTLALFNKTVVAAQWEKTN
jgi:hypothetical protein